MRKVDLRIDQTIHSLKGFDQGYETKTKHEISDVEKCGSGISVKPMGFYWHYPPSYKSDLIKNIILKSGLEYRSKDIWFKIFDWDYETETRCDVSDVENCRFEISAQSMV